jgi:hypothetical protein
MGNVVLISPHESDKALVTGAATQGNMTITNLRKPQPTDRARFALLTSMHVVFDLGSAKTVKGAWFGYSNFDADATIRRRAASTEADLTAAPGWDPDSVTQPAFWPHAGLDTDVWTRPHGFFWWATTPQTFQWWRFDFSNPGNAAGYGEIGRVILFIDPFQPAAANAQWGALAGTREEPRILRAEGGPKIPRIRPREDVLEFTVRAMTKAEAMRDYRKIVKLHGASEPLLVCLDPDDLEYFHEQSVYGLLTSVGMINIEAYDFYGVQVAIEEMP